MISSLEEDPGRIPVLSVEAVAPDNGNFHWRDHFHRMLAQMREPLIDQKLNARRSGAERAANGRYTGCPRTLPVTSFSSHLKMPDVTGAPQQSLSMKRSTWQEWLPAGSWRTNWM